MDTQVLKQSCFLEAIKGQNKGDIPIWLMRQVGRYMPKFQEIRAKHSLLDLFTLKEHIAPLTCMGVESLKVDAAILFTDLLVTADLFDRELYYLKKGGPQFNRPLNLGERLVQTKTVEEALSSVLEAIPEIKSNTEVPLIGFIGSPFTLYTYLIESESRKEWRTVHKVLNEGDEFLYDNLSSLYSATLEFAKAQIRAGADVIQIFDSSSYLLSKEQFSRFSFPYLKRLVEELESEVPVIVFARESERFIQDLVALNCPLSIDSNSDLTKFRALTNQPLQGNLPPELLLGDVEQWKRRVDLILREFKDDPGFIFNLGHGVLQQTSYQTVIDLIEYIRSKRNV